MFKVHLLIINLCTWKCHPEWTFYSWLIFVPFSHMQIQDQKAYFWYIFFLLLKMMISYRSATIYSPNRKMTFPTMLLGGFHIFVFFPKYLWTIKHLNVEGKKRCYCLCQRLNTLNMLHIQMYSINILIKNNK